MTDSPARRGALPVLESARDARPGVSAVPDEDMRAVLAELGEPAFRAKQVADAVWQSAARSWDEVTTLGLSLRATLAERFTFDTVAKTEVRPADGGRTEKALHRLADGRLVESVLMHYPARGARRERNTLCVSSQAGCAVGCPFCATGELGFERDLAVAEIVDQVRQAARRLAPRGRRLTNLVFMGMGEPLLNLDAVVEAARILTDPARFGLGARHLAISTSGVVPGIARLATIAPQWTLAISLHAARDPLRDLLVPVNRRWPVAEVVAAAAAYQQATGRRVSYEYVMIEGINDTPADAAAVGRLLAGEAAHVNLIPMNPVAQTPWRASGADRLEAFAGRLMAAGVGVTIRRNRGAEVGAACGQLAAERAGEAPPPAVGRRREQLSRASAAALRGERSAEPAPPGMGPEGLGPPPARRAATAQAPRLDGRGQAGPGPMRGRSAATRAGHRARPGPGRAR